MITKYILPLLAVVGLSFAIYTVVQARQTPPPAKPIVPPPERPGFRSSIAGAGLIEARMENIPIGSPTAGVVYEVFVKINDHVKKGDPLFRLDDRAVQAELKVRQAALVAARAQLARLKAAPRPEDVPPAEKAVEQAEAMVQDAKVAMDRTARLLERGAGVQSEHDKNRFTYYAAKAGLEKAQADLYRIKRGTWEEDLRVAETAVLQSQSMVEATQIDLERLVIRTLADGQVLQVNVRPGQFAALAWREPMVVLGDVKKLHVRVDVDEQDLPYFKPGAKAVATLKGRPQVPFTLEYVKVEPYVIPKKSLTGDNAERVDTRVLQVIYALPDERQIPLFVGQQMDVYLEAAEPPKGVKLDADPDAKKPFEKDHSPVAIKSRA